MDQKDIWNAIAPEWFAFKTGKPAEPVEAFLKKTKASDNVLDLGCGSGRHFCAIPATIHAVDFSPQMIKYAKEHAKEKNFTNIEFEVAPAHKLPFKNDFFAKAIYISAMHCIPSKSQRKESLKEIFRTLKKGGELYLSNWNKASGRFANKEKEDTVKWRDKGERFYYFYDQKELEQEVKEAGFEIVSSSAEQNGIPHHSIRIIAKKH